MKKIFLLFIVFILSFHSNACDESYLTIVSIPTDIGSGQYSTTVNVCIGQTINEGGTFDFTLTLNGANFISYTPLNLTNTYNAQISAQCLATKCKLNTCSNVSSNASSALSSNIITYTTSSSTPNNWPLIPNYLETCGSNPISYCFTFTFISDNYPSSLILGGNIEYISRTACYLYCGYPLVYKMPCNGNYNPLMNLSFIGLPIELEEFNGYNEDNINKIYWVTATEINNDFFTLERSRDGKYWEEIFIVKGGGTTNTPSLYEFNDVSYINGVNYYRLKQTDFDGKSETFKIISINNKKDMRYLKYIIVNLLGQKVDINYKGIRIVIYEDGRRLLVPNGVKTPVRL